MSPISQLKYLLPYRNQSQVDKNSNKLKFNKIYSSKDLFEPTNVINKDYELEKVKVLTVSIEPGDILYIPAYFFQQVKATSDISVSFNFEYLSNSRILDNMFKVLFDDTDKNADFLK